MPLQANSVITLLVNSRRWSSLRVMFSLTKKLCGNYLYWLNILYLKFFHLTLKNRVCREIFHCIEYIFYHSGSLSNLRLCWKTEFALKFFTVGPIEYTFTFRIFEQLAPALKTVCPELTELNIYFLPFRIFEQLALALKFFTVLIYFLSLRIFEQPVLALKTELPWNFLLYWYTFYHSGFLSNLRFPWINCIEQPRNQGGGHLGHLTPPKFSKHCMAIVTFTETFKEKWNF